LVAANDRLLQSIDRLDLPNVSRIKPKEVNASDLFRRLNSYSKRHTLYRAHRAFG
jgi:TnpA family transposase